MFVSGRVIIASEVGHVRPGYQIDQWLFLVPLKGGRWHSPSPNWQEKYHLYTTYSPCRTWGVKNATDPTCYGNQKQPLNQWDFQGPPTMGPPYGKLPILFP